MGKYNHIPELAGSDNYLGWKRDPSKPREFASYCPVAVDPLRPTASESKIMDDWILRDCAAKSLISRKVSSTVSKLLPDDVNLTARDCWNTLAAHFHHNASSLQFELHSRMSLLHMKDLDDAERFLSEWKDIAQCFSDLSADSLSDEEAIFNFVGGLPATPTWDTFKSHHTRSLQRASRGIVDIGGVSTPFFVLAIDPSFDLGSVSTITLHPNLCTLGSPTPPNLSLLTLLSPASIKTTLPCTNPACASNPRHNGHDLSHCFQIGGGIAGQAPWLQRPPLTPSVLPPVAVPPVVAQLAVASSPAFPPHFGDLLCAVIQSLDLSHLSSSTILDSGTTSTLIMDRSVFWSYQIDPSISIKTANEGTLASAGRGDCLAILTLNGTRHRLRLRDCIHAPGVDDENCS
ncbi:hypothetical protein SERLA73DRAFT_72069 [Serpula lacrymans var. lacrymans S7.3]|uniref:Uncharacterized protein n=1 Tax=Serpula lacrymans var. lacrymans (strain S7.3) TaxID=936435 RepID=F8PTV5_SERL3|nr:hypothetical protein SERLA73DRAFT_72069 [Serpula lacrymans var. lacrymans S7.3]